MRNFLIAIFQMPRRTLPIAVEFFTLLLVRNFNKTWNRIQPVSLNHLLSPTTLNTDFSSVLLSLNCTMFSLVGIPKHRKRYLFATGLPALLCALFMSYFSINSISVLRILRLKIMLNTYKLKKEKKPLNV